MRRLLFILSVLIMVSCCPTESVDTITIETNQIDVRGTTSYFYQFTYKEHEYITNFGCDFVYHMPSCPCKSGVRSILDYE